eukprot:scaffold303356_cov30-Tisochrysis_lutea.AAC.1
MKLVANSPANSGSSEKYSKLRPQRGWRLMFTPGPSSTPTSRARHSRPSASPTCRTSTGSHDAASAQAQGKQVAGAEPSSPRCDAPRSRRTPCGPSETLGPSTPSRLTLLSSQKVRPEHSEAFSRRLIWRTSASASCTKAAADASFPRSASLASSPSCPPPIRPLARRPLPWGGGGANPTDYSFARLTSFKKRSTIG